MANDATIEQLQIEVEASAKHAQSNIRALSTDLKKLSDRCHGGCGLSSILDEFKEFNQATDAIKAESLEKMANLADALGKLKGVGKVNLPSNISSQITEISTAASAFGQNAITGLQGLSDGLTSLSQVGKISISSTLGKHLTEIVNAGAAFNGAADTGFGNLVAGLDMLKGVKDATISSTLADHLLDVAAAGELITPTATSGFANLADSLRGFIGLESVKIPNIGNTITGIVTATEKIDASTAQKLSQLADGLKTLTDLPTVSSSLPERLNGVVSSVEKIGTLDTSKIQPFVQSMEGLGNLKISSTLNTQITKLAETADKLKAADFSGLINLNAALAPLAGTIASISTQIPTVANGLSQLGRSAQQSGQQAGQSEGFWKRLFNTLRSANFWTNLYAKMKLVFGMAKRLASTIAGWIDKSNQYIENVNLFTASMGEYAQEAQEYAEKVGAVMGIDPGAWMRNQGVFNTIITGFGVVGDRAYKMSKNLTQLGYDISSFFNISVDDAMKKLSSGISGELEPLRRLGFDLSATRLQEEATALGINKKVSAMTQAEKAELRYHAILTQVTVAQGDMARTLDTPANQLRILKAQVEQCARAFGNIFIPILNAVLPYAIALANAIRTVAQAIAGLFGFKMPEVDYSGISTASSAVDDLDSSLGSASGSAKKLKETLAGFDELNIIAQESGGSGKGKTGTSGAGGGGFDFELPEYDFLGGLIGSKADEILQKWQPAIDWILTHLDVVKNAVLGVAAGLAMWNIGRAFNLGLGKTAKLTIGIALAVYGVLTAYKAFKDQWENGVTLENMQTMLEGVGSAVLGLGIAFGTTGWGVGLLIGGLVLIINPLKEFIETGKMTDEMLGQLSIGILAIGAGIALLTGSWIPVVIAAVGVAVAWVVQKWDDIKAAFVQAWEAIESWWNTTVVPAFNTAVEWIDKNVLQPVVQFFVDIYNGVVKAIGDIATWWTTSALPWINEKVEWVNTNIVQPVVQFFVDLYQGVVDAINGIPTWWTQTVLPWVAEKVAWVDSNIVQPVVQFFVDIYDGIIGAINSVSTWWTGTVVPWVTEKVKWVEDNILNPVIDAFTKIYQGILKDIQNVRDWWTGTAEPWINDKVQWVDTNIVQPVVQFFTNIYDGILKAIGDIATWWTGTVVPWINEKITWIDTTIVQPVCQFFTDIYNGIVDTINGIPTWWTGTVVPWINEKIQWIDDTLVQPVVQFFTNIYDGIVSAIAQIPVWWTGTVVPWVTEKIAWVDSTIVQPVCQFFTTIYDGIVSAINQVSTWWTGTVVPWITEKVKWIEDNLITPVKDFFKGIHDAIQEWLNKVSEEGLFTTIFNDMKTVYNNIVTWWTTTVETAVATISQWVTDNIVTPVTSAFNSVKQGVEDSISGVVTWWDGFKESTILPAVTWVDENVTQPISGFFSTLSSGIQSFMNDPIGSIKEAWGGLKDWFQKSIIFPIENFFIGLINGIIDGVNWLIGKLNSFNITLGPWNLWDGQHIDLGFLGQFDIPAFGIPAVTLGISGIPTIEKLPLKEFGEGGFPEMGQMFIARERGAELVGEIGGRTAVANNEQIDRGIAEGVRDANAESNELLREQNEYLRQLVRKKWSLEPSTSLARTVKRSEEMRLVTEGV